MADALGLGVLVDAAETVAEALDPENIIDKVQDLATDLLGDAFMEQLKGTVDQVLTYIGPKAGEHVVEKAAQKYPKVKKADDVTTSVSLTQKAIDAATAAVMGLKEWILDFCDDVMEMIMEGFDGMSAALTTFRKVLVMLLKALRGGVQAAVSIVTDLIPDCCEMCIGCWVNLEHFIATCYNELVNWLEDLTKGELRERCVPAMVTDKIEWNASPDEDVGEPKKKMKLQAKAPAQQELDG